jgi:hypothetical protein
MEKQQRLREKQKKEALDQKEKEKNDEFWAKWYKDLPHHFLTEKHDENLGLREVEHEENYDWIVQKHTPEALIRIINKKYNSNSYNPEHRPTEYFIRLSSIQEWFGYEPKQFLNKGNYKKVADERMADEQYFAHKGMQYGHGTIFHHLNGKDDLYDVAMFQKQDDAVRGRALKALQILVPKWWKNEDNFTDVGYDVSWFHWDLTKLLAQRLGIDLQKWPELASCFMVEPDLKRVSRLFQGFKELDKKYGRDKNDGRLISEEARDLLQDLFGKFSL